MLQTTFQGYHGNGLTGDECVPKDIKKPEGEKMCVNDEAHDKAPYDPNHGYIATTERIYACKFDTKSKKKTGNPCEAHASITGNPSMQGFVQSAEWLGKDGLSEMSMWSPEKVPIITTLAKEFANFDNLFASYPGSTWPNRAFFLSGTAKGMEDTGDKPKGFGTQKTIFR